MSVDIQQSDVLRLDDLPDRMALLRWNKELPAASTQDPLGLNLRVSARLAAELLHCITSITPRARYYAFFPWAIEDYAKSEKGKVGDRGLITGVVVRERAMVLGAVLHHNGQACEGGALGGSNGASTIVTALPKDDYDLEAWQHLDSPQGQLSAAYQASLVNLGLFETAKTEVNEEVDLETNMLGQDQEEVDLSRLSARGKKLAAAFREMIKNTDYASNGWPSKSIVDRNVLTEYGSKAGLCEINDAPALDRGILTDVFFSCDRKNTESAHYTRRMSLLLVLECVRKCEELGVQFDQDVFSELMYFGKVSQSEQDGEVFPAEFPEELVDIAKRWQIFYFHSHLATALQSFLVSVVRVVRDHEGGIDKSQLLDQYDGQMIAARISEVLHRDFGTDFMSMSPAQTLSAAGWDVEEFTPTQSGTIVSTAAAARLTENQITEVLLNDNEVNGLGGIGLSALLLFTTVLRYQGERGSRYDNWYRNHVSDPTSDISLSGLCDWLNNSEGHWWEKSNREVLSSIVWKYLVIQHQRMSYDRGFGGSSALFHLDGTTIVGTGTDYTDPSPENARLPSAFQILVDLGLLKRDVEKQVTMTSAGLSWLKAQLKVGEDK